jgi:lysophospholipase L1-like esterase
VYSCFIHTAVLLASPDGDINTDGQVNAVDALWGQQVLLENRSLSPDQFAHGDVAPLVSGNPQPDGVFDLGDVLIIHRIVLGMLNFSLPEHQFNIGDSIGEGEAADGTIGEAHHETVWSTGYNAGDSVNSFNERFETIRPVEYYENNASRDAIFNHAVSGSVMADFATQAQNIIAASVQTPSGEAGVVNVFLGSNDVCAPNMASMTDPAAFETQFRAGLDVLAADTTFRSAQINVSSIPAIYWLWNAKRSVFWCRVFVWPFVPCENLLDNPSDDCESSVSRGDPDNVYPGDGANCQRRKEFHRLTRDTYNPILRDILAQYRESGILPNARYTDIFDVRFESSHVNSGDCFHPSTDGHALLAEKEWCKTHWGNGDPACAN